MEWNIQLERSYINISSMSVLLFNLHWKYKGSRESQSGLLYVSWYFFQMLARLCGASLMEYGLRRVVFSSRCDASCWFLHTRLSCTNTRSSVTSIYHQSLEEIHLPLTSLHHKRSYGHFPLSIWKKRSPKAFWCHLLLIRRFVLEYFLMYFSSMGRSYLTPNVTAKRLIVVLFVHALKGLFLSHF